MRIVCLICDVRKPSARNGYEGADWCDGCGRLTRNREVASDNAVIAPGSSLRFRDQRKLYLSTEAAPEAADPVTDQE